jgi:hypothetical protein
MPDPDPQTPPPKAPPPAETFSKEYVHELRADGISARQKATDEAARAKAAEEERDKVKIESDAKVKASKSDADARVIRAELKALAIAAGMVDLDGLKLADLSTVKINKDGEVEGAAEMMEALKKAKPYLFGAASTSTTQRPPTSDKPKPKLATQMTKEEYQAAKAALIAR